MSVSKLTINSAFGVSISPITFNTFLSLIPIRIFPKFWGVDSNYMEYHIEPNFRSCGSTAYMNIPYTVTEHRLRKVFYTKNKHLTYKDLLERIPTIEVAKGNLEEMVQDIVYKSVEMMGTPRHVVRLDSRLWLAADPTDFEIYASEEKHGIICYKPNKQICWKVTK